MNFETKGIAEDYTDDPKLHALLQDLPSELASIHIKKIEEDNLTDEEAADYLKRLLEKREGAMRISKVSDRELQKHFQGREEEVFGYIEGDLSFGDRNLLGKGATAKIKAFYFETPEVEIPMAVKYLLTPLSTTLSAAGEHDMIVEVERIQQIEDLEKKDEDKLKHIRVPHPYFHHKNKSIQCYGMELVDGITLQEGIEGAWVNEAQKKKFQEIVKGIPTEELIQEVDIFFENMHELCLHGDVKPANIMIGSNGIFYIIDFGQSELVANITNKTADQLETRKEDEKKHAWEAIRNFYRVLFSD